MSTTVAASDTSERILDVAEHLVQTRGYNGFSYADIAAELRITKASLHYHYATKAKLGERLVERYREKSLQRLAEIEQGYRSASDKLRAYVSIYAGVLNSGRMCLCGILAAEFTTLPEAIRLRVRAYFESNEAWLAARLAEGRADAALRFEGEPPDAARYVIATLEGAMLLAHTFEDVGRFHSAARILSATFAVAPDSR